MKKPSKLRITVIAASFTTVAGVFTYFGIPIPRPAWSFELQEVQADNIDTRIYFYDNKLDSLHARKRQLQIEIDKIQRGDEIVPDFYIKELSTVENEVRKLTKAIAELQHRKENL